MIDRRSFLTGAVSIGTAAAFASADRRGASRRASPSSSPLALVYRGPASSRGIPEDTAAFLRGCPQRFRTAFCGPGHRDLPVGVGTLAAASLFVQPGGGDDFRASWESVKPYAHHLRAFLRNGGRYLGICMGGYLAGSGPGYGLLPGNCDDYTQTRGSQVRDARNAVITVDWPSSPSAERRRIFYQDGPYFWLEKEADAEVLARYTNGLIAAMAVPFGNGRVAVCGPHPEANRSWFNQAGLPYPGSTQDLAHQLVDALMAT